MAIAQPPIENWGGKGPGTSLKNVTSPGVAKAVVATVSAAGRTIARAPVCAVAREVLLMTRPANSSSDKHTDLVALTLNRLRPRLCAAHQKIVARAWPVVHSAQWSSLFLPAQTAARTFIILSRFT